MAQRAFVLLGICGVLAVSSASFAAEGEVPAGNHAIQPAATPPSVLYVLTDETSFVEGCFPPCLCPIQLADSVAGTFSMRRTHPTNIGFSTWAIEDLEWNVVMGGEDVLITGTGMYLETEVDEELHHRLLLTVQIGDEDPTILDSGLVPGGSGGGLPAIDIAIDEHDLVCLDTLIQVHARASVFSRDELQ